MSAFDDGSPAPWRTPSAATNTPGYQAELNLWTRRYAAGRDGIPISGVPPSPIGWRAGESASAVLLTGH